MGGREHLVLRDYICFERFCRSVLYRLQDVLVSVPQGCHSIIAPKSHFYQSSVAIASSGLA